MATTLTPTMTTVAPATVNETVAVRRAYQVLHLAFVVAPIVAGLDKFFNLLADWEKYLAPLATEITGLRAMTFMQGVGVIEVIAGIGVLYMPRIFGYVVSAWIVGIIINLLILGGYYDIALRDLGLAMGAFALAKLAEAHDDRVRHQVVRRPVV